MTFGARAAALSGVAARWLGWRPAEFWDATPTELELALHGGDEAPAGAVPSRREVEALMALHPDEKDWADGR